MKKNDRQRKNNHQMYNVKNDELIIRDHLAADRTALANERTLLSYARTAFAFAAGGLGLIKLWPDSVGITVIASILISAGIVVLLIGFIRFIQVRNKISSIGCNVYLDKVEKEEKGKLD